MISMIDPIKVVVRSNPNWCCAKHEVRSITFLKSGPI